MQSISTSDEYDDIVDQLTDEFRTAIDNAYARDVAVGCVGNFELHDHSVVVHHEAEVFGDSVDTLDQALNPYDVLQYGHGHVPIADDGVTVDTAAARAIQMLASDLLDARTVDE